MPYDYTVEVTNRFKGLSLIDRVPDELRMEVRDIVQETGSKTIPKKKECTKAKRLAEEALQVAVKRREAKSKAEKERERESEVAQSCPTLCDPVDCSPPGSPVHGILQARVLEWVAIFFSNAWEKGKGKVKSLSRVQLFVSPWTAAHQAPPPMGFSRQEYWNDSIFLYILSN